MAARSLHSFYLLRMFIAPLAPQQPSTISCICWNSIESSSQFVLNPASPMAVTDNVGFRAGLSTGHQTQGGQVDIFQYLALFKHM